MKEYLKGKLGKKLGVARAGVPKEVYFEAVLDRVTEGVAVFKDDKGREVAVPLDKILMVGPADDAAEKPAAGFCLGRED